MYPKREKRLIFLIIVVIVWILIGGVFNLKASSYPLFEHKKSVPTVVNALVKLGKRLGKDINKNKLIKDLISKKGYKELEEEPPIEYILKAARSRGIFLNAFKLQPKELDNLKKIERPFIAYCENIGYRLVEVVNIEGTKLKIKLFLTNGKVKILTQEQFSSLWDGVILSFPLMKIMATRVNAGRVDSTNRFISIFLYHFGESFKEMKEVLENLWKQAQQEGKKIIYIDELGLIPKETVEGRMKRLNISEEEAFNQIKESIFREDEMLEKGIPLNIGSPFYRKLYKWLAKHRVKSLVEDLTFKNWQMITRFDESNVLGEASKFFFTGQVDKYINYQEEYMYGFWLYNVKKRDDNFRKSIEEIIQEYPNSLIFTVRGIGHYGFEEKLKDVDFQIDTYVLAEGNFEDNMISSQLVKVYWENNVDISEKRKHLLFLKGLPQLYIRQYLEEKGVGSSEATRESNMLLNNVSNKQIKKLAIDTGDVLLDKEFKKVKDIGKFMYDWIKKDNAD